MPVSAVAPPRVTPAQTAFHPAPSVAPSPPAPVATGPATVAPPPAPPPPPPPPPPPAAPPPVCRSQCADTARSCKSRCKGEFGLLGKGRHPCMVSCETTEKECRAHAGC
jgi:hypothetical protein